MDIATFGTAVAVSGIFLQPCVSWLISHLEPASFVAKRKIKEDEAEKIRQEYLANRDKSSSLVEQMDAIGPLHLAFPDRSLSSLVKEAIRSQANREKIAGLVIDELNKSGVALPQINPLDEDWQTRFYRYASDISTEQGQMLWAKLLAGEIRQPGSFSLQALDILRNLTKENAEHLKFASQYMFTELIMLPMNEPMGTPQQPNMHKRLQELSFLGLVSSPASMVEYYITPGSSIAWRMPDRTLIIISQHSQKIAYKGIPFAKPYSELLTLETSLPINNDFIDQVLSELQRLDCQITNSDGTHARVSTRNHSMGYYFYTK